jgi:endonuclease III
MRPRERAERIGQVLDDLYPHPPIPLRHEDPFTLLVAVMLSAQTTDKKVNEVTPALFRRGPTPAAMARVPEAEILDVIRTLGLAPTKAKHVRATAQALVRDHGGQVPREAAALEALPGVGHKTACVVRSQAFGEPAFAVDTHIHRLAARWGLSDGSNVRRTEQDLQRWFAPETWNRRHLQMIYFGREHCPALRHDEERCPICSFAGARARKRRAPRTR